MRCIYYVSSVSIIFWILAGCDSPKNLRREQEQQKEHAQIPVEREITEWTYGIRRPAYLEPNGGLAIYYNPINEDKYELQIEGAPPFVHPLRPKPDRMEPELKTGVWLIIVFPIVSHRDIACLAPAIRAATDLKRVVNVGIRPFEDYDETEQWYGEYGYTASPLWLILQEGEVLYETKGPLKQDEIRAMLEKHIPLEPN